MPQTSDKPGLFIVLEGIDGAGTTTQLSLLKEALEKRGRQVHLTCEPSNNPVGLLLRQVLSGKLGMDDSTVALLFAADRLNHLAAEIEPALQVGKIVISDRYYGSSAVYQGPLCGSDWVAEINSRARCPDLTLFFHLPVAVASRRRARRGGATERFEDDSFLAVVQSRYEEIYKNAPHTVWIDAAQSVEAVFASCLDAILPLLDSE